MTFEKRLRTYLRQRHLSGLPIETEDQRRVAMERLTPRQRRRLGAKERTAAVRAASR